MFYLGYWCTTDSYIYHVHFASNPSHSPFWYSRSIDRRPLRHHFVGQEPFSFCSLSASVPSVLYISLYIQMWRSIRSTGSLGEQKSVKKQGDILQKSDCQGARFSAHQCPGYSSPSCLWVPRRELRTEWLQ